MSKLVSIEPNGPSNSKEKLRDLECCVGENKDGRVKERELNTMELSGFSGQRFQTEDEKTQSRRA